MLTAQAVFESSVAGLSKSERLKLATLILEELTVSAGPVLDFSDSWSDEDIADLTAYVGSNAGRSYPEGADGA